MQFATSLRLAACKPMLTVVAATYSSNKHCSILCECILFSYVCVAACEGNTDIFLGFTLFTGHEGP
jgi:hypothetical protein